MVKLVSWKVLVMLTILAIAVLVPICVEAQEAEADTSSVWEVKIISDGAESSGTEYVTGGCRVFVPRGGKYLIQIVAIDLNWNGKKLEQIITVEMDKGRVKKKDQRYVFRVHGKYGFYEKTKGYDIFFVKYRGLALKLPPEVRQLFHGLYGIGEIDFKKD